MVKGVYKNGNSLMCMQDGEEVTFKECARRAGIPYQLLYQRVFINKMSLEDAIGRPTKQTIESFDQEEFSHKSGCRCGRCKKLLLAEEKVKRLFPDLVPILAPNPRDDGKWFKQGDHLVIEFESGFYTIQNLATRLGLDPGRFRARLKKRRWAIEEAIKEPKKSKSSTLNHGTKYCYDRHRCRCDLCRAVNAQYSRQYYEKKTRP